MSSNIFELDSVSFAYPDGRAVLEEASISIRKGDLVVVKGVSGAGKSTFLKLFNRFCDYSRGALLFHDRDIRGYAIEAVRKSILYLPQLPYMIEGTVTDNLYFPFTFHAHRHKEFDETKARQWLDYFQLDVPLENDALKLSTGQKQRIALIRAMLLEPEVLLLDEPCSSVDDANKRLIEKKIESHLNASDVTVIMATHGEVSLAESAFRNFHLDKGRLIETGK